MTSRNDAIILKTAPADSWTGNREPSLRELLCDPVMESLLVRDGLSRADVHARVTGRAWDCDCSAA